MELERGAQEVELTSVEYVKQVKFDGAPSEVAYRKAGPAAYLVHPDRMGTVILRFLVDGVTEEYMVAVKLIEAEFKLGGRGLLDSSIKLKVLQAQMGIYNYITTNNICGSCMIHSYKVVRVSEHNRETVKNSGGPFSLDSQQLISCFEVGDLLLIREIQYRCAGYTSLQRAPDMVFTID